MMSETDQWRHDFGRELLRRGAGDFTLGRELALVDDRCASEARCHRELFGDPCTYAATVWGSRPRPHRLTPALTVVLIALVTLMTLSWLG